MFDQSRQKYHTAAQLVPLIRSVRDFPEKGVLFRDITPLLADAAALRAIIVLLAGTVSAKSNFIASIDARGFIFGAAVAAELGIGFVPIRKPGKLPAKTVSESYQLEYGTGTLEIHADAVRAGSTVWVMDDLLATGGTLGCTCSLLEKIGANIAGITTLIELDGLGGRSRLNRDLVSLITLSAN